MTQLQISSFLVLSLAFAGGGKGDDNDAGESSMAPLIASPVAGATGKIEVNKSGTEQEFHVAAKGIAASLSVGPLAVWMEDAGQNFFKVSSMSQLGASDHWLLKLESNSGAPAALGVADVADLTNRKAQVRDAAGIIIFLEGTIPAPEVDAGGGGKSKSPVEFGAVSLQRPMNPPDSDAMGSVNIKVKGTESEFDVEAEKLDTGANASFSVQVETGVGTNIYFLVGPMTLSGDEWNLELEGSGSPPVALQVASISDLAGRNLQIIDHNNAVVLQGILPAPTTAIGTGNVNKTASLTIAANSPSAKANGKIRSKFIAKHGSSELDVRAANLAAGNVYNLFVEDGVGSNVFVNEGAIDIKGKKTLSGRILFATKKGDMLPFGASNISILSNRKIEIRDGGGVAHLKGIVP